MSLLLPLLASSAGLTGLHPCSGLENWMELGSSLCDLVFPYPQFWGEKKHTHKRWSNIYLPAQVCRLQSSTPCRILTSYLANCSSLTISRSDSYQLSDFWITSTRAENKRQVISHTFIGISNNPCFHWRLCVTHQKSDPGSQFEKCNCNEQ